MTKTSGAKVKVEEINQVALVVKDIQKTMENYWNILAIGPWDICEARPPLISKRAYHGKPGQFAMKVATTMVGSVILELIEPMSGDNIYTDFMAEHGEGLHHLMFLVNDANQTTRIMNKEGFPPLMSGHWGDGVWAYYDTTDTLKTIWEIFQKPERMPPPHYHYPEKEE